jgi:hypothetical protein
MIDRISISLDEESKRKLDFLRDKISDNTSEVIRGIIDFCFDVIRTMEKFDTESIKIWIDYLAEKQHMILDIEHWRVIFSEIEKCSRSDQFWEDMEKIGLSHAIQYKLKGLDNVEKILKYVERANWYGVKCEAKGVYTLILNDLAIKKFVKVFLEKVFQGQDLDVEIKEGFGKLIIVEKN